MAAKERRAAEKGIPVPIVVPPSQYFEGVDGSWSTFNIRVGNPAQSVRVIASTNSPQTIVVQPAGCADAVFPRGIPVNCAASRGGVFNLNESSTWINQGWYSLNNKDGRYGFEANLGYNFNLNYGLDSLGLDYKDGPNAPTLNNQTVAAYNLPTPLYTGLFGLGTQPVLYDTFGNFSAPSYFHSLRTKNMIPSLSWSSTAGASYRLSAGQYSQVIFGGYDSSRFQPNNVQFRLSADVTRDIVVAVQDITFEATMESSMISHTTAPYLRTPIYAFIESTDPNIWLPRDACDLFEVAFGLSWDDSSSKYLMSDAAYTKARAMNPTVTFRLGVSTSGGSTVSIMLPFEAFALKAQYPFVANSTRYFPLKRAANATQYTLGRTFLQEAYLTVDYDLGNFTVSQCTWNQGAPQLITAIVHPLNSTDGSTDELRPKTVPIAGIVGGVVGGLAAIALIALVYWFWRKQNNKKRTQQNRPSAPVSEEYTDVGVHGFHEADNESWLKAHEVESNVNLTPTPKNYTYVAAGEIGGNEIYPMSELPSTNPEQQHEMAANKENDIENPAATLLDVPTSAEHPARAKGAP